MAFRGYGDDAMKVKENQRQHSAKMAQIAAQERASQRSASVAMAGQAEQARQADMADNRASEQLAERSSIAGMQIGEQRAGLAASERARKDALAVSEQARNDANDFKIAEFGANEQARLKEQNIRDRQLQVNEGTFLRLEEAHQNELKVQEAWKSEETALGFALMRKMAASNGPLPPSYFNAINAFRGKAVGDEGYITGGFPSLILKQKLRLDGELPNMAKKEKRFRVFWTHTSFLKPSVNPCCQRNMLIS